MLKRPFTIPRHYVIGALLVLATVAVYWPVMGYDFVYLDDDSYVFRNPHVSSGLSRENIAWAFTTWHGGFWIPLTWLSFMLDAELFGLDPAGFHLTNLILHAVNTLLLFGVLRAMTGAVWRSGMAAALFALHPLHVESVAWVTERKDVLSTAFLLAALWAYARYARRGGAGRYGAVLLLFALGLMAKPMIVTLPLLLLLLDWWPLRRFRGAPPPDDVPGGRGLPFFSLALEKFPMATLAAISGALTYLASGQAGALGLMERFPLSIRAANAFLSYVGYVGKTIWPMNLAVFYAHPGRGISYLAAGGAALFVGAVTALTVRAARRAPYLSVGWLWYLAALVPVIGLVQAGRQSMADRFTYVPSIGLFLMLCWGAPALVRDRRHGREALVLLSAAMLAVFVTVTWRLIPTWRNTVTLLEHAIAVTEGSPLAHYNLGTYHAEKGDQRRAEEQFLAALRIEPDAFDPRFNLGVVLAAQGRTEEAIMHYRRALEVDPGSEKAHTNLGVTLTNEGRAREALPHLRKALELGGEGAAAYLNLGLAYTALGQWDQAVESFEAAVTLDPGRAESHFNLAYGYERVGRPADAVGSYRTAISLDPDFATARFNLALLYLGLGRRAEAVTEYRHLQKIDPARAATLLRFIGSR